MSFLKISKIIIFLICFMIMSCINHENKNIKQNEIFTVEDFTGKKLSFKSAPCRVVCLVESALTGIFMLQAQEAIVGIPHDVYKENFYKYYSQLDVRIKQKTLPFPGNWDFVNIEQVISLKPDMVIMWSSQKEAIANLERLGIPVYAVFMDDLDDIYKEIRDFGLLFGKQKRAESLINHTKQKIAELVKSNDKANSKGVYFMWSQGPLETSGKKSTVTDLISLAGMTNICDLPEEHLNINIEKLYEWNPDFIVMWSNEKLDTEDVLKNSLFSGLSAIKNKKVYEMPEIFKCDFWTLKFVYPVYLIKNWGSSGISPGSSQDSLYLNGMFYDLYGKKLLW